MAKKKKAVPLGVGAEKGPGAAASRRFAKEGYHVLVAGRTSPKVEKVAAANGSATPLAVDGTKGGLRLLVQSLAREFGPQGLHIAHAIIDGGIEGERLLSRMPDRQEKAGADGLLNIEAIGDSYRHMHAQHRSAWTHEIDLRPYKEPF
jgi:NAD(P)-dependent dehydrogenase (short-subunit alcohol dehydrogenase family)